ncbi:YbdK family carboxylate-amine ligase [Actinomadura sp. GC306]|uniref:carboxylate-amine ligase n=1 Tax=Actinomadura sp. GC306 TaxID=2530367 RepID=UPI001048C166|nr:glutamate--cysteine ligase [Actinomadura sp. GC306]TDC58841.1 YbdK family carboxylate-amine ligase [Actinomadura sp. GC306]
MGGHEAGDTDGTAGAGGGSRAAGGATVGVEEEFLLVDALSGASVPRAGQVLAAAGEHPWRASGGGFHPELLASQVEAATGVCGDLAVLRAQLRDGRARLAAAARAAGARLVSAGAPVLDGPPPPVAPGDRFAAVRGAYGEVVADYQACGCHVHVGVPDRETAVQVVNHLRPWLPTLAALAVNSPFGRGRAGSFAGRRIVEMWRFPGAGVPPFAASAAEHDGRVAALVEAGALVDGAMTFWLARPSPRWPTVEVRAADAAATADEAVLQAALSRGLVGAALRDLAAGREAPRVDAQVCAAALWSAARHGMRGHALDPFTRRRVPPWRMVEDLLARARPALAEAGDLDTVRALLAGVRRAGTGADRQRRAAGRGGPRAVVEMLARHTESGVLPGVPEVSGGAARGPGGGPSRAPQAAPGEEQGVWDARERVPQPDTHVTTEDA